MPRIWFSRMSASAIAGATAILFAFAFTSAQAEVAVPPLKARVTDITNTLTPAQAATLEQKLADLEQRKGAQIAILIVPTTAPEPVEQYAVRVFEDWKLGRKGVDDGVLLLISKDEHRLKFEVGYGLEGVVPDVIAKRVIDEIIVPAFRQGDFFGGIDAGVTRLMGIIDGEPLPPPKAHKQRSSDNIFQLLPMLFIAAVVIGGILRTMFGRFLGAGIAGSVAGLIAWVVTSFIGAAVIGALVVFVFVLMAGMTGGRGYGGWSSGGGWGGGFGGGGGGGFSGGGGSSGGGGASGSW